MTQHRTGNQTEKGLVGMTVGCISDGNGGGPGTACAVLLSEQLVGVRVMEPHVAFPQPCQNAMWHSPQPTWNPI